MVVLALVPVAVFGLPALAGRLFMDGDNYIQNFPLRVLVGHDLRHGVLPLLDPYLYGGTPLLAGFNAGAAYPFTWLFAVLPASLAWIVTQVGAYDAALVGMYLFLRRQPVSATAATFGAGTFACSGYMVAQTVHIDLVAGAAWLPWILLALHALTGGPDGSGPARGRHRWWAALRAGGVAMTLTSGGVEALVDGAVLAALYLGWRVVDQGMLRRARVRATATAAAAVAGGLAGGVVLGAAQWLPGLSFVGQSQRAAPTYQYFTSGSLDDRLLSLLVSPFLLGTNQDQPAHYFGTYNFPEVAGYVGILALIAACSLVAVRRRDRPEARSWWVWYAVLGLGVLSVLGSQTPFGHLMYVLPGVNRERLLNRNLLLVDFALAALLAWWVHVLLDDRARGARPRRGTGTRVRRALASLPLLVAVVACVLTWTRGPWLQRELTAPFPVDPGTGRWVAGLVTATTVVAAAATWLAVSAHRLPAARLRRLLATVVAVDLAVFAVFTLRPPVRPPTAGTGTAVAARVASLAAGGRVLVYDPDQFEGLDLIALGQTDTNVLRSLPSGQGYAALVGQGYADATGAHLQDDLAPATLAGTTWDDLGARVLFTLPSYFVTPVPGAPPAPRTAASTSFPPDPSYTGAPVPPAGPVSLAPGAAHVWYLGGVLTVSGATVPVAAGDPAGLRVGLLAGDGATRWLPAGEAVPSPATGGRGGSVTIELPAPERAAGIVVSSTAGAGGAGVALGVPLVRTVEDGEVRLDGRLQSVVQAPHWRFAGTVLSFGAFTNTRARGPAWVTAPGGGPAPAGTAVTRYAVAAGGTQTAEVHATGPAHLVLGTAWAHGWRATVRPAPSGPAVGAPVLRAGTVQAVALPGAGDYVVTVAYRPPAAILGVALSAGGGALLVLWLAAEGVVAARRRRRGRRPVRTGSRPPAGARP